MSEIAGHILAFRTDQICIHRSDRCGEPCLYMILSELMISLLLFLLVIVIDPVPIYPIFICIKGYHIGIDVFCCSGSVVVFPYTSGESR